MSDLIYKVVCKSCLFDLQDEVNEWIKSGWVVSGGISVSTSGTSLGGTEFYQAIVKTPQTGEQNGE